MTDQKEQKTRVVLKSHALKIARRIIDADKQCVDLSEDEKRLLAHALLVDDAKHSPGAETAPTPIRITADVLARSRSQKVTAADKSRAVEALFAPAKPPPGVVPKDAPKMAFDEQSGPVYNVLGWAAGAAYNSAFLEGTTWLGYAYLSELAQRAEYRVMSEEIGSEMTREWIELKAAGEDSKEDKIVELETELKRLRVQQHFKEAAIHDGFFGRAHIYIDTGDTDELPELKTSIGDGRDEISAAKVNREHRVKALRNVEPVWVYPTRYDSNDPLKPDWYKPTSWFVMGKEVHTTRLLTLIGRTVPDLLKPAYSFGGLSMSQMAKPYVDNWLRTRQSVADLIQAFSVMVLKTDLATTLMNGGEQLFARLELFNNLRNNKSVMALDKTSEDFTNVSASLSGLHELQAQTQEHMASVSRIPLVKLLGIQPSGLNASSEGEIRTFYDWIKAFQEALFREPLERIINFVMLSLWGEVDKDITFDFVDLWQLDQAAKAAVDQTKAATDETYVAMGAISAGTVRKRLQADPDSPYAGIDLDEDPVPDPMDGMQGEFDFGEPGQEDYLEERQPEPQLPAPKPQGPGRGAGEITSKAESFGSPASGGFSAAA